MSLLKIFSDYVSTIRPFWHFVYFAFNRVDVQRLAEVGPDRCCAEWILRNGGAISLVNCPKSLITNYNLLPSLNPSKPFQLHSIVAEDVGLLSVGFDHLEGCQHLRSIKLIQCDHIQNDALRKMDFVKSSLRELEIRNCGNIGRTGLLSLVGLKELEQLTVAELKLVPDLKDVERELRKELPRCSCFWK